MENQNWLDIMSAVKDENKQIIVYRPDAPFFDKISFAYWDNDKFAKKPTPFWRSCGAGSKSENKKFRVTHWMKCPDFPNPTGLY